MPAGEDRSYSGNAVPSPLTASLTVNSTGIPITSSTGWPDGTGGPFFIQIDSETIKCSSRTGLILNVQTTPVTGRGWDGTTIATHTIGTTVQHVFTATDAEDANEHISDVALDHHTQYLTVARHDLSTRHGFGILPTAGTPSTSLVGDTASGGSGNNVAKIDHKHAREGFGSPVRAAATSADGSAITVARSDHRHAGGIPILTSTTRPSSPVAGESIIESDTFRNVQFTGTSWIRSSHYSVNGRTGVIASRVAGYLVPDGGPSSYIIPFDTEVFDSDGFLPAPDGTTTTTLTVPSGVSGLYSAFLSWTWASVISARCYAEIIVFDGAALFQYRTVMTGDDRGSTTAMVSLSAGYTVQMGAWQNSGSAVAGGGGILLTRHFA